MVYRILKSLTYLLLGLLLLVLLLYFLLHLSPVQNFAKDKLMQSLSERLDSQWKVDNINIDFFDELTLDGVEIYDQAGDTLLSADKLWIDIGIFDLLNKRIKIDDIELFGARVNIYEQKEGIMNFDFLMQDSESKSGSNHEVTSPWDFSIRDIRLVNSRFSYTTVDNSIIIAEEEISISIANHDLNKKQILIDEVILSGIDAQVEVAADTLPKADFEMPSLGWEIEINTLSSKQSNITYTDGTDPISIRGLKTDIGDIVYGKDQLSANIKDLAVSINEKVKVKTIAGHLTMNQDMVTLPSLKVLTDKDELSLTNLNLAINDRRIAAKNIISSISYRTLQELESYLPKDIEIKPNTDFKLKSKSFTYNPNAIEGKDILLSYGEVLSLNGNVKLRLPQGNNSEQYIKADLKESAFNLQELENIFPLISIPDSLREFSTLTLKGEFDGILSDFKVDNLEITIDDVFTGILSGTIQDVTEPTEMEFYVNVENLSANVEQLPIAKSDQIAIDSLGILGYNGIIKGNLKDIYLDGALVSDLGGAEFDMQFGVPDSIQDISYKGKIDLDRFKLGVLLKNEDYDEITIVTKMDGRGVDLSHLDTKIDGIISNFSYNGYEYEAVALNATVRDSSINGELAIDDPNLKLSYSGIIELDGLSSIFDFSAQLDTMNLAPLGFAEQDISFAGAIVSKFYLPLKSGQEGSFSITDFVMSNPSESFYADTILLKASREMDSTFLDMRSDFATIDMDGEYIIRDLPSEFKRMVDHHMPIVAYDSIPSTNSHNVSIDADIKTLRPLDLWLQKQLIQAKNISIQTQVNFDNHQVDGEMIIDSLFYADNIAEKINVDLMTADDQLKITTAGKNVDIGGTLIPNVSFDNEFKPSSIYSTLVAADDDKLPRLKFAFETSKPDDIIQISFQDSMILNQKDWLVSSGNKIELFENKLLVSDLEFTDSNEFLRIASIGDSGEDLELRFKNFNVGQFPTLLTAEPSKFSGNIDGEVQIKELLREPYYLVNLRIDDMVYDSSNIGVLSITADDDPKTHVITTSISLKGPRNDLVSNGTYNTMDKDLDFEVDINSLQMVLLDPFFTEIFYDSEGVLSGYAKIGGTVDQPVLDGNINLKDAASTIVVNNVRYFIKDHDINFDNDSFQLGNLSIRDKDENISTVTGQITHDFLEDFYLDLNMITEQFLILNTSSDDNPVFHGKLLMDANTTIKGPPDLLDISIVATMLDSNDVTLSPLSIEELSQEEEYITFGKPDDFIDNSSEYLLKVARMFPFNVDLSLNVTKAANLNFIVDPISGDKIEVRGIGDLLVIINPDGQQEIYGTCAIESGTYNFSYGDFISRQFQLKPGGTIRFDGDPLNASLDIDAIYNVYTSTYGLIKNEISLDGSEQQLARERTNVEVYLSLEGTIENPLISLDIEIPEEQSNSFVSTIDRKLNQLRSEPNQMNTQVFNLLIFDNFLVEDNTISGSSIGSTLALNSISSLISNELNRLAENVIKGVDVSINVDSYDTNYATNGSGGTVTELGLNVTKQLFNDRLSLSAGGNIDFTDNDEADQSYASLVGDFILEYKLVESGKFRLRVFSKSDYDRLLDESRNRNGVSLFFNKAFDSKTKR